MLSIKTPSIFTHVLRVSYDTRTKMFYSYGPCRVLWATDRRAPGNETKDESAPDLNTPGFELETQWSEVECSTGSTKRTALTQQYNTWFIMLALKSGEHGFKLSTVHELPLK